MERQTPTAAVRRVPIERRRQALLAARRRQARVRRRWLVTLLVVLGVAAGLVAALSGRDAPAGRLDARPDAVLTGSLRSLHTVPGRLGALPWPAKGQAAIVVLGHGLMARSPRTNVVPIASLTKMMTAYLVLRDHPLDGGAEGPTFVMDAADVAAYVHAVRTGESNVAVAVGERLTERQLLEALLIPSADNIADYLAVWDAGSTRAFVARMNATARALGLTHTHYADASGVSPGSRSDATDQASLAARLMRNPVVRGIVSKRSLPFPVAGTISNYNPALGVGGVIGVKSGFTSRAQSCLATAAYRTAAGHDVLVVAVTLGQTGGLGEAARVDEQLLDSAGSALVGYRLPLPASSVGTLSIDGAPVPLYAAGPAPLVVGWPGMELRARIVARPLRTPPTAGRVLAELVVSTPAGSTVSVPLTAATAASPAGASG
jgi:serine-type D-Ala-D-Ala carboxypeptidase (penicillin-binding protein 5/6)